MEMLTVAIDPRRSSYLVLTHSAVLLLSRPMTGERLAGQQLGALGAVAQSSSDQQEDARAAGQPRVSLQGVKTPLECTAAQVPLEFASHPHWPSVGDSVGVSLYPKAVFQSVSVSLLWGVRARIRGHNSRGSFAAIPFWKNGVVRAFLRRAGYPME
jgi:hypothetical protein